MTRKEEAEWASECSSRSEAAEVAPPSRASRFGGIERTHRRDAPVALSGRAIQRSFPSGSHPGLAADVAAAELGGGPTHPRATPPRCIVESCRQNMDGHGAVVAREAPDRSVRHVATDGCTPPRQLRRQPPQRLEALNCR